MKERKKKIVFYSATTPTVFLYKLGILFKKNNYETILFTTCEKNRFNMEFYKNAFNRVICSNFHFVKPSLKNIFYFCKRTPDLTNFLFFLKRIKPYAVIGVAGSNWQLRLVHKYFFKKYPFIYLPYDILSHFFNSLNEALEHTKLDELTAEKYCFENSDGILHKGSPEELSFISGRIFDNINIVKDTLSFMPYCSEEYNVPINKNKLSKKDKEFHTVYVGGFLHDPLSKKSNQDSIKKLLDQNIHVHVYALSDHCSKEEEENAINDFFGIFIQNKYFHLHHSLEPKELIKEISQYDFGLFFAYDYYQRTGIELNHSTGNKISSYLEAGLPIIYDSRLLFVDRLMKPYNLNIYLNEENILNTLQKINYTALVKQVEKMRSDFDMDRNFSRLNEFIETICKSVKKSP